MTAEIIQTAQDLDTVEMTESCARDLTNRIKHAGEDLSDMLWRAHQGKAWKALGYDSWKQYCETEFRMSKQHSYRLLDFVEIRNVIGHQLVTPQIESQVRPLTQLEPEQQPAAWERAVEIAEGEQPTSRQVEQAVVEISKSESEHDPLRDVEEASEPGDPAPELLLINDEEPSGPALFISQGMDSLLQQGIAKGYSAQDLLTRMSRWLREQHEAHYMEVKARAIEPQ